MEAPPVVATTVTAATPGVGSICVQPDIRANKRPADDSDRFPARATVPVPDRPPFTAHVGNLSFDVTEGEISDFFASCDVSNVRLVRDRENDRPKGFGYVEFNSKDGLLRALDLNGSQLAGRNVRVNVAEPRRLPWSIHYGMWLIFD
jgi:RNA recognition motif-containing protein